MLAHLDEIDRWRYVEEAFRVLRPGWRLFLDSIDIESDQGWTTFRGPSPDLTPGRPPYMPRASTAAELENYARRAGFGQVSIAPSAATCDYDRPKIMSHGHGD